MLIVCTAAAHLTPNTRKWNNIAWISDELHTSLKMYGIVLVWTLSLTGVCFLGPAGGAGGHGGGRCQPGPAGVAARGVWHCSAAHWRVGFGQQLVRGSFPTPAGGPSGFDTCCWAGAEHFLGLPWIIVQTRVLTCPLLDDNADGCVGDERSSSQSRNTQPS